MKPISGIKEEWFKRFACDRCGKEAYAKDRNGLPGGWSMFSELQFFNKFYHYYLCDDCTKEHDIFMKRGEKNESRSQCTV